MQRNFDGSKRQAQIAALLMIEADAVVFDGANFPIFPEAKQEAARRLSAVKHRVQNKVYLLVCKAFNIDPTA
jgi:hypothetical protein